MLPLMPSAIFPCCTRFSAYSICISFPVLLNVVSEKFMSPIFACLLCRDDECKTKRMKALKCSTACCRLRMLCGNRAKTIPEGSSSYCRGVLGGGSSWCRSLEVSSGGGCAEQSEAAQLEIRSDLYDDCSIASEIAIHADRFRNSVVYLLLRGTRVRCRKTQQRVEYVLERQLFVCVFVATLWELKVPCCNLCEFEQR